MHPAAGLHPAVGLHPITGLRPAAGLHPAAGLRPVTGLRPAAGLSLSCLTSVHVSGGVDVDAKRVRCHFWTERKETLGPRWLPQTVVIREEKKGGKERSTEGGRDEQTGENICLLQQSKARVSRWQGTE